MSEKLTKDDIIALYTIFMRRYVKFASIYLFLVAIGPIADYISMYLKNFTISIIIGEASIGIISVYYITLLLKSAPLIKLSRLFFGSKNMLIYSLLKAILLVIYFLINTFLPYYNVFLFETIAMPLIPIFLILPPGSPAINRFNRTIYKLSIIYILFSPIYYFSGITNSFLIISLLLIAGEYILLLDRVKVLVLVFLYIKGPLSFTELLNMINEVNDIEKKERITKGNLDSHVRILLKEGLVERRESFYFITGKRVIYKITERGKEELFNTIKELQYLSELIKKENKK